MSNFSDNAERTNWKKYGSYFLFNVLIPILVSVPASIIALRIFSQDGEIPTDPVSIAGVYIGYTTLIFTIMSVALVVISIFFGVVLNDRKKFQHEKVSQVVQDKLCQDAGFKEAILRIILSHESFKSDFIQQIVKSPYFATCFSDLMASKFIAPPSDIAQSEEIDSIRNTVK